MLGATFDIIKFYIFLKVLHFALTPASVLIYSPNYGKILVDWLLAVLERG